MTAEGAREISRRMALRDRRAWGVIAACAVVGLLRSLSAAAPAPTRSFTFEERQAVGREAAAHEPEWRLKSARGFPGDCWSADDDFHASEWTWVRDTAAARGVSTVEVLRAIDEDLRRYSPRPPRKSNACPCKPRPFYN